MNASIPSSDTLPRRPIRDLPDELISQIAAGEVVERPASVVRELVDNALDAGARQINVRLLAGGVRLISVEDDGGGIPRDELPVALRRHATSKITDLHDLETVATMGFRGEALAAICSVSEASILSRPAGQDSAYLLDARSGELRPAARNQGTTVEVKELFFSTPARRKFLKSDATELAHCIESVRRHALARPDVGFAIWHEGKLVEQWRAAGSMSDEALARRLGDVLGDAFVQNSVTVEHWSGAVHVTGRAGVPDAARSRPDHQFCYVNGRFVRDKVLTHAARSAYEDVLHGHRQPVYALYVEMDPARVDVNVHPTKIEVRFRDSREVHSAVRHAAENALAIPRSTAANASNTPEALDAEKTPVLGTFGVLNRSPHQYLFAQAAIDYVAPDRHRVSDFEALWPQPGIAETTADKQAPPPNDWVLGRAIAQLQGIYILSENAQGLVVVDMHAAHERIVYERLKTQMDTARILSQPLLIPATFAASPQEVATAESACETLALLGLEITPFRPKPWPYAPFPHRWRKVMLSSWRAAYWRSWPSMTPVPSSSARRTSCCRPWRATARCAPIAS